MYCRKIDKIIIRRAAEIGGWRIYGVGLWGCLGWKEKGGLV